MSDFQTVHHPGASEPRDSEIAEPLSARVLAGRHGWRRLPILVERPGGTYRSRVRISVGERAVLVLNPTRALALADAIVDAVEAPAKYPRRRRRRSGGRRA